MTNNSEEASFAHLKMDPALRDRRTASDYVADSLRQAIFEGRFGDGEELNQVELARHFNVSRVPVREALRRLQAEGLVKADPHRRAVVIGLSRERIAEIFEIRHLLEGHMLERAANAFGPEDYAALRALCDRMDRQRSHSAWLDLNREFHHRLLEPAGMWIALDFVEQLTQQVQRYLDRSGGVDRAGRAGDEHRRLLDALEHGDTLKARTLLERHIGATFEAMTTRLGPG